MVGDAKPLLISLTESLREVDPALKSQGESIYAQKPNLGANGVTWSQENYAHLGLQAEYLRLKSIQRFTEGWVEFAEKKMPIRANSLHPGFVVTPLLSICCCVFQRRHGSQRSCSQVAW